MWYSGALRLLNAGSTFSDLDALTLQARVIDGTSSTLARAGAVGLYSSRMRPGSVDALGAGFLCRGGPVEKCDVALKAAGMAGQSRCRRPKTTRHFPHSAATGTELRVCALIATARLPTSLSRREEQ